MRIESCFAAGVKIDFSSLSVCKSTIVDVHEMLLFAKEKSERAHLDLSSTEINACTE